MEAPSPPPPPPPDPLVIQAETTAQNQTIAGLQQQDRSNMASLMAAYGTLAMGLGSPGTVTTGALGR
jgi:hypothetical protein